MAGQKLSKQVADTSGAAAVEFALLIGPLLFLILGILEISLHYFVATSVDFSTQRVARLIRTGQAQEATLTTTQLKAQMCNNILDLFDCSESSYISVDVLTELSAPAATLPVNSSGDFIAETAPKMGTGGQYVIVRSYFQFSPLLNVFGNLTPRLSNGNQIVVSSALFRNEPF